MTTIVAELHRRAMATPRDVLAIVELIDRVETITCEVFWAEASGVARGLLAAGIREDDVVLCIGEQSSRLLYAIGGCLLRGAVPSVVPYLTERLDAQTYRRALKELCRVSEARAAIVSASQFERSDSILRSAPAFKLLAMEDFRTDRWISSERVLTDRDRIVILQHSSGTTGLQKGVALSNRAIIEHVRAYWACLKGSISDVVVSWLPLYHDMGLIAGFLLPLLSNVPLVLLSPFDWIAKPITLLSAISRHRGTLSWLPNFAFNVLAQRIRDDELAGLDLSSVRTLVNCSEPVQFASCAGIIQRLQRVGLREVAVTTCYAMAENTFAVTQGAVGEGFAVDWVDGSALLTGKATPADHAGRPVVSCGRPLQGVEITIDIGGGKPAAQRQVGEIAIRSPYTLHSYFNRPDLSSAAFRNGWFMTGDLGYIADGELFVCGRSKDLVIIGGVNFYPHDFETVADTVKGVKPGRTVAFGLANDRTGTEDLVLVVEADPRATVEPSAIRDRVRRLVAQATGCVPREVHVMPPNWLLKTSSGKISRRANKEKLLRALSRPEYPAY